MKGRDRPRQRMRKALEDTSSGTSILRREKSAQLFFVYPGKRRQVAGLHPLFLLRSGLGDRNIAVVRDPKSRQFEDGIDETLPTFESVIDWHKRFAASLDHVREIYGVGSSSGGFSSLMFGHLLGVRAVYAFGPRGKGRASKLRRLLATWNGVTEYHIHYSDRDAEDKDFAEGLAHLPHVTLHPADPAKGYDHLIMSQMAERGELKTVFPPPLEVPDL